MPEPVERPEAAPSAGEDTGTQPAPGPQAGAGERKPARSAGAGSRLREEYPAWDRILHDFFRPTWSQLVMGLVLCLVSAAVVVQVRHKPDDTYSTMRRADLVQLLDQLNAEQGRLEAEQSRLERTRQQLASGADAQRVAEQEARKRLESLGILNGTLPATGPGIRITIVDGQHKVTADMLVDAVQELRDAGAEAMQVNGTVRVVASTWFADRDGRLVADGTTLTPPYTLEVIGEPHALEEGARFRGGLVSQVQAPDVGGQALISRLDQVQVTALHTATAPQWAHPA